MASITPPTGELLAWDPVKQEAVWRAKYPVLDGAGVLATAGNLIFQGRADGNLAAYRATDGEPLWRFDAATGMMAPPVTYTVGQLSRYRPGRVGWFVGTDEDPAVAAARSGFGRILTFALNGTARLDAPPFGHKDPPVPAITAKQDAGKVHQGLLLFNTHCMTCHGLNAIAGPLPDFATRPDLSLKPSMPSSSAVRERPPGCRRSRRFST